MLTTIEGIIDRAVAGLEQDQPARRVRGWEGKWGWEVLGIPFPACWSHTGLLGRALGLCFVPRSPLSAALGCPAVAEPHLGVLRFRLLFQATDGEVARKIDEFIGKLRQLKEVRCPFTFVSAGSRVALAG